MGACLFVPHCWFINGIFQLNKRPHSNSVFLWQVGWKANLRARGAASPWTCSPLRHQQSLLVLPFLMQIAGAPSKELKFSVVPRKPGASAHSSYFKCVLTESSHALLLCCWFCVCWVWSGTWPHLTLLGGFGHSKGPSCLCPARWIPALQLASHSVRAVAAARLFCVQEPALQQRGNTEPSHVLHLGCWEGDNFVPEKQSMCSFPSCCHWCEEGNSIT